MARSRRLRPARGRGRLAQLPAVPEAHLTSTTSRWVNVLVTPIVAGTVMATLGHRLGMRHRPIARRRRFTNAYAFALVMAIVRMVRCA